MYFWCRLRKELIQKSPPCMTKHQDISGLDAFHQTDTRWQSNQGLQVPQECQGAVLTAALICLRSENHGFSVDLCHVPSLRSWLKKWNSFLFPGIATKYVNSTYEGTSVDQWWNESERRNEDEQTDYQNLKRDENTSYSSGRCPNTVRTRRTLLWNQMKYIFI